ncbi:hypothetical protein [Sphingomonas gellani]|nr:hypothetical protein [Sphingomonas gellani]
MTVSELQDLLIAMLVRRIGGNRRRWRIVLGPVRLHDRATHPLCNWSISPTGTAGEVDAAEHLLDTVRLDHPLVTADRG